MYGNKEYGLLKERSTASLKSIANLIADILRVEFVVIFLHRENKYFQNESEHFDLFQSDALMGLIERMSNMVLSSDSTQIIEDLREAFSDNNVPVAAFAGLPLLGAEGETIGTLCIFDERSRVWSRKEVALVQDFGIFVTSGIKLEEENKIRQRIENDLVESQRRLFTLMGNLPGMVYRCTPEGDNWVMEFISEGCTALTGYNPAELIGDRMLSYAIIVNPEDQERIWDEVQHAVSAQEAYQTTYRITTAQGEEKWVWEQGQGVYADDGTILGIEGFTTDITESKQAEELLAKQAEELLSLSMEDALTGLYNRRGFTILAEQQLKLAARNKKDIVLLFADMDGLKWINDNLGHQYGDEAIAELGNVFKRTFRDSDIVARIGGDEFVVFALEAPPVRAEDMIRRLKENLATQNQRPERTFNLEASIGYSVYSHEKTHNLEELLEEADKAMYQEKAKAKKARLSLGEDNRSQA